MDVMEIAPMDDTGVTAECLMETASWLGTQVCPHLTDEGTEASPSSRPPGPSQA